MRSELLLSFFSLKSISGHYHKLKKKGTTPPAALQINSAPCATKLTPFLVTLSCPQHDHFLDQLQSNLSVSFNGNSPSCAGALTPFAVYASGIHSVITLPVNLSFFMSLNFLNFNFTRSRLLSSLASRSVPESSVARAVRVPPVPDTRAGHPRPAPPLARAAPALPCLSLHSF